MSLKSHIMLFQASPELHLMRSIMLTGKDWKLALMLYSPEKRVLPKRLMPSAVKMK
jgi:hypothetical protein